MQAGKKKGKYELSFKLRVIHWAEKHSNRAAGNKFGLNESTIRGWRKVKDATVAQVSYGGVDRGRAASPSCSLDSTSDDDESTTSSSSSSTFISPRTSPSSAHHLHRPKPSRHIHHSRSRTSHPIKRSKYSAAQKAADEALAREKEIEIVDESVMFSSVNGQRLRDAAARFMHNLKRHHRVQRATERTSTLVVPQVPEIAPRFPEFSMPVTVIVSKTVRAHLLQRKRLQSAALSSTNPNQDGGGASQQRISYASTEQEHFAKLLGLRPSVEPTTLPPSPCSVSDSDCSSWSSIMDNKSATLCII